MSKYNFKIENYHAIGHADIDIDGITVIAGGNGCGKSTLSRWLYYILNIIEDYEFLLMRDFHNTIGRKISDLMLSASVMSVYDKDNYKELYGLKNTFDQWIYCADYNVEKLHQDYNEFIEPFSKLLDTYLSSESDENSKKRILSELNITKGSDPMALFKDNTEIFFTDALSKYTILKEERKIESIWELVFSEYQEKDEHPSNIQLKEDGVSILTENIGTLLGIKRSLYIDTPIVASFKETNKPYWKDFLHYVKYKSANSTINDKERKILKVIESMINGKIIEEKNYSTTEMVYKAKSGVQVKLDKVASGFKTFAYMQRLIENGWLDNKTLLEIDEPETNLHPQWIVEFAHLLVMVNKELGTKIMIASHNPDMVSAIRYISEKEGILEKTHFYLAVQRENSELFDYKYLGNDIDPVFESFNKSYETLQKYVENYGNL